MSSPHGTTIHEIRLGNRTWSRLWASKAMHLGHAISVRCYEASDPSSGPLWGHDVGSGRKHHGVRTAGQVRQQSIGLAGLTCFGSLRHTSLQLGITYCKAACALPERGRAGTAEGHE